MHKPKEESRKERILVTAKCVFGLAFFLFGRKSTQGHVSKFISQSSHSLDEIFDFNCTPFYRTLYIIFKLIAGLEGFTSCKPAC